MYLIGLPICIFSCATYPTHSESSYLPQEERRQKKADLKSRLKHYQKPFLEVFILFSDTAYNCSIHYYQRSRDFSPILKSRISLLNCASSLLPLPYALSIFLQSL
jgi:hypothetical protein